MARPVAPRRTNPSEGRAPGPAQLSVLAAAALCGAAAIFWLALHSDHVAEPGLQAALIVWIVLPYVFAGLVAWRRQPDSRFGPLMVVAGFATLLSIVGWANAELPFTFGQTFDLVGIAVLLHVFLAFPSGRLELRFERWLVVSAYAVAIVGVPLRGMLGEFEPRYLLTLVQDPGAALAVRHLQLGALAAACLLGAGVLLLRRRGERRPLRRWVGLLVDSFAAGLVMIALLLVSGDLGWPMFETVRRVTFFVLGLAPLAFLIGLLDVRLGRAAVGDLLLELRAGPAPAELRDALARALRDPSLELAFWLADYGSYRDVEGRPVELPRAGAERATTLIERNGACVAALLHDPALREERELLDAVSAAAGIALENAQLQAELRAHLDELQESRGRIVEASQRERQRLERNLHDGAQARLVGLSLELGLLEQRLNGDAESRARLERARREVAASLDELRDVAAGIHPAVVSGHGLAVALESLAARGPVPVSLAVELDERLPEALEVAAYYVVSESLTNIGKHARATRARIDVGLGDGQVVVEVVDDGIGGADPEAGTGLRGLADRVEAIGGRLRVWTPRGGGTRVRAELPCGW